MRKSQITGAGLVLLIAGLGGSATALAEGTTTIGGKMYSDFSYITSTPKDAQDGYGVDVKRFYFGADHKFDNTWSVNITTDFTHGSPGEKTQVFIKKAYFQVKFSPMATLRVGSADMPWIPYAEHVYGYRYVENTLTDKWEKGSTSADWGLHLLGKNRLIDYQVSLVNGRGYADFTRSKTMDISARVGFHPVRGLTLAIGGRTGKRGQDVQGRTTPVNTASRFDFIAGYNPGPYNIGVEYFTDKNMDAPTGPQDKADGVSVFGDVSVTSNGNGKVFARFDYVKPSKDLAPSKKITYENVGYSFSPRRGIDLAVVYKHTDIKDNGISNKTNEFGLWTQVAF